MVAIKHKVINVLTRKGTTVPLMDE